MAKIGIDRKCLEKLVGFLEKLVMQKAHKAEFISCKSGTIILKEGEVMYGIDKPTA